MCVRIGGGGGPTRGVGGLTREIHVIGAALAAHVLETMRRAVAPVHPLAAQGEERMQRRQQEGVGPSEDTSRMSMGLQVRGGPEPALGGIARCPACICTRSLPLPSGTLTPPMQSLSARPLPSHPPLHVLDAAAFAGHGSNWRRQIPVWHRPLPAAAAAKHVGWGDGQGEMAARLPAAGAPSAIALIASHQSHIHTHRFGSTVLPVWLLLSQRPSMATRRCRAPRRRCA